MEHGNVVPADVKITSCSHRVTDCQWKVLDWSIARESALPIREGTSTLPFIKGYTRRDGTVVRRHWRAPAGTNRETALAIGIVAAVLVFGGSSGTSAGGSGASAERLPAPQSTSAVTYPIKWPAGDKPKTRPAPTVSYPIRWPGWKESAPRPVPTVSYPIRWDRNGGGR